MKQEKDVVVASTPAPSIEDLKDVAEAQEVAEQPATETEQVQAQELDEHSQQMMKLVEEIVDTFKPRIANGELTPYEVAEALSISLTGTLFSIVPPNKQKVTQTEAEAITRKMLKTFDQQAQKRRPMFVSQMLAGAKVASYIVSHGNRVIGQYREEAAKAVETSFQELDKVQE